MRVYEDVVIVGNLVVTICRFCQFIYHIDVMRYNENYDDYFLSEV